MSWQAHDGPVTALSFSDEGIRLASAGTDGVVRVWDFETGRPARLGPAIASSDTSAADAAPGASAASAASSENAPASTEDQPNQSGGETPADAWLVAAKSGLRGTLGSVTSVALRADGKEVTAGMEDGSVTVWNLESARPRALAAVNQDEPESAPAAKPSADQAGSETEAADAGEAASDESPVPPPLAPNGSPATVAVVSPNGELLATSGTRQGRPPIHSFQWPADICVRSWGASA